MANTGVSCSEAAANHFNNLFKLRKSNERYVIYHIVGAHIEIEKTGPEGATFDAFVQDLAGSNPNSCRYAVYDMNFTTTDGREGNKIVFVSW